MNQIVQTPVVPVSVAVAPNSKASSNGAAVDKNFQNQLNLILNGEAQVEGKGVDPALLVMMLSNLAGVIMPEKQDEMKLEQVLTQFIKELEQSPELMKLSVLKDTGLQEWLKQAAQLLESLTVSTSKSDHLQQVSNTLKLFPQLQSEGMDTNSKIKELLQLIQAVMKTSKEQPQSHPIQRHVQSLKEVLEPIVSALGQLSSLTDSPNGLSTNPVNGSMSEQLKSLNLLTMYQLTNGRFENKASNSSTQNGKDEVKSFSGLKLVSEESKANLAALNKLYPVMQKSILTSGMQQWTMSGELSQSSTSSENTVIPLQTQDLTRLATAEPVKALPTPVNAQHFSEEMAPLMIKHMKFAQLNGFSEARITLVPEHLGQVDIRITMQNGHMVAQFMTDSLIGKEMLDGQLMQLRTLLQSQGIQVDRLEVSQQDNAQQSSLFQESRHQHQTSQQFSQQNKGKTLNYENFDGDYTMDLGSSFAPNKMVYGNSFDKMA